MASQTCLDCKVLPPFSIILCPLHAAAPEMWRILASLADCGENGMLDFPDRLANDARALLAKLEP